MTDYRLGWSERQRKQQNAEHEEFRRAIHEGVVRAELHYTWANPHEWLAEQIASSEDPIRLRSFALSLLGALDSDQVQDIFQAEMVRDGYFEQREEGRA